MKRKFKVTVNGEIFTVEVEEIGLEPIVSKSIPQSQTIDKISEKKVTSPVLSTKGIIEAPLPGVVSKIVSNVGDNVEPGSLLMILEAMKMENEIYSNMSGVVKEIYVQVGQQIGRGDRLIFIE